MKQHIVLCYDMLYYVKDSCKWKKDMNRIYSLLLLLIIDWALVEDKSDRREGPWITDDLKSEYIGSGTWARAQKVILPTELH